MGVFKVISSICVALSLFVSVLAFADEHFSAKYYQALSENDAAKKSYLAAAKSGQFDNSTDLLRVYTSNITIVATGACEPQPLSRDPARSGVIQFNVDNVDYELQLHWFPANHFEDADRGRRGELTRPERRVQILLYERLMNQNNIPRENIYIEVYRGSGIDLDTGEIRCELVDAATLILDLCAPIFPLGEEFSVCNLSNGQFVVGQLIDKRGTFTLPNLSLIEFPIMRSDLPDFSSIFTTGD